MAENTAMSETSAPIRVDVTQAQCIYGGVGHPVEIYKNESPPRGIAFIVNIKTFVNDLLPERKGSDVDVRNSKELFEQMGYVVQEHHDLSREELRNALNTLSENSCLANMDSLVVIIMSHGKRRSHVVAADGQSIKEEDFFEYFNNTNCPHLQGKPKIFILQFCRGDLGDCGVGIATDESMDNAPQGETDPTQKMPTCTDFIIIYSTLPGYVAYRDPNKGSWLIESLCLVFMEHAHNTDLDMLLNKLSLCMRTLESSEGRKQAVEIRKFCFDRQFYFNPLHITKLQDPQFPVLPYSSELQPSGSGLTSTFTLSQKIMNLIYLPKKTTIPKKTIIPKKTTMITHLNRHAVASSNVEDEVYNMKHLHRGYCIIFNQKTFDISTVLGIRKGSDRDRDTMSLLFTELGFEVEVKNDLTVKSIKEVLHHYGTLDHSDNDCFVIVFMSHGDGGELYGKDKEFKSEELFKQFTADECPTLAGKPKMFFIQANGCAHSWLSKRESDSGDQADFLMCWATLPGCQSWRNTTTGSWFIQSLYEVFTKCASSDDVFSLMTKVNCYMIKNFKSNCPSSPKMHGHKQSASINSSLTKKIYLT